MNLPSDCQNFSSSGFQSEIQAVFRLSINLFLSQSGPHWDSPRWSVSQGLCQSYVAEKP
jgi:hypothetical protein